MLSGVVLCFGLRKDNVSNLEVAMRWASVAGCVPGTIKLFALLGICRSGKGEVWASLNLTPNTRYEEASVERFATVAARNGTSALPHPAMLGGSLDAWSRSIIALLVGAL